MARKIRPENIDERMLTREQRLGLQRRGSFMPAETGVSGGTFFNPARIAGQQPESAGVVGPNYRERLAEREAAARRAKFQGAPESPTITAMREQAQASQTRARATQPLMSLPGQRLMGNERVGPSQVGGQNMTEAYRNLGSSIASSNDQVLAEMAGVDLREPGALERFRQSRLPTRTPQQKAQDWADVNTAANAEIVPAGAQPAAVPKFNLFGGGDHLDSAMLAMGRDSVNKDAWNAYRTQTQDASRKLNQALATRASVPATVEEAQQFIDSLGFDDRVGQHVENEMMNYITRAAPGLANQLIGEKKADQANDSSYVQWVKRNATDPEIARASTADILAARTPESDREFENDINADHFEFDPVTGQPMKRPPRKLTPIEEAQQLKKTVQATVDQSNGQLQMRWRLGKPEAISVEELTKERTEDIDKQIDNAQKGDLRARKAYDDELIPKEELKKQIAIYFNRTKALQDEKDRLAIGATPAAQVPGAAQPIPSQDKIGEIIAGLQRTDLTIQEREYLQQKLQQLQPQGAPSPAGGKGSITRGGETITRADVAPKPGTGSITRGGKTTHVSAPAPAAKPVAKAAPYVAPITKVQDMLAREPAMPKPLSSKEPAQTADQQRAELLEQAPSFDESDIAKYIGSSIKSGVLKVADVAKVAGKKALERMKETGLGYTRFPVAVAEWEIELGKSTWNRIMISMEDKLRENWVNEQITKKGKK